MNGPWRSFALLAIALVVAGCIATRPPYPADYTVELPSNSWGQFSLDVYDSAEFVLDARSGAESSEGFTPATALARPEANEIDVSWTGGPCAHRPFLHVRGGPDDLDLEIVPEPTDIGLVVVDESCPAVGIVFSVTLTLAGSVSQSNVSITQPD